MIISATNVSTAHHRPKLHTSPRLLQYLKLTFVGNVLHHFYQKIETVRLLCTVPASATLFPLFRTISHWSDSICSTIPALLSGPVSFASSAEKEG